MQYALTFILALALALIQPALSVPAMTAPVASTVGNGGKTLSIKWVDNGKSPKLSNWNGVNIFLATGDVNTQYKLQQLAANVSDSKKSASYVVDASIGPNGGYYFIRMDSVHVNKSTGFPYMAFSSKFTLNNMTGKFNSTVSAAASSGAALASGSSSTSTGVVKSVSASSSPSSASSSASMAGTTGSISNASTSGAAAFITAGQIKQSLVLFGIAFTTVAGIVVLL